MLGVAAGGGGDAAMGVRAADVFNFGEDAGAIIVGRFEKKPGNGGGFGGRSFCDYLASDGAAIVISPAGAGTVDPYFGAGCVEERCVGSLEDPLRRL